MARMFLMPSMNDRSPFRLTPLCSLSWLLSRLVLRWIFLSCLGSFLEVCCRGVRLFFVQLVWSVVWLGYSWLSATCSFHFIFLVSPVSKSCFQIRCCCWRIFIFAQLFLLMARMFLMPSMNDRSPFRLTPLCSLSWLLSRLVLRWIFLSCLGSFLEVCCRGVRLFFVQLVWSVVWLGYSWLSATCSFHFIFLVSPVSKSSLNILCWGAFGSSMSKKGKKGPVLFADLYVT